MKNKNFKDIFRNYFIRSICYTQNKRSLNYQRLMKVHFVPTVRKPNFSERNKFYKKFQVLS